MSIIGSSTQLPVSKLTTHIEMGLVELNVSNMAVMKQFYVDLVGLEILSEEKGSLVLGFNNRPILHLEYTPELTYPPADDAGLYHTAIVFESPAALAKALKTILTHAPFLYSGSADHLVSEAFYFTDPQGNGVELYYDTDPATWEWKDGRIVMGSIALDINTYIKTHSTEDGSPVRKTGHVHLKVGDIEEAKKFYVDILGLHLTALMPSALFISDGKYHHNIGMNTWESAGAGPRVETLGLRSFEIIIKNAHEMEDLKARLNKGSIGFKEHPRGISLKDPWNNAIIISN